MTKAPEFRAEDDLIEIHMDGEFVKLAVFPMSADKNTEWQPRVSAPQLDQFFLHESVANSLMASMHSWMPLEMSNNATNTKLYAMLPEIEQYYGNNTEMKVQIDFKSTPMSQPIQFNSTRGIVYGGFNNETDVQTQIRILVKNETTTFEEALVLDMSLELVMNATFNNFLISSQFTEASVKNTVVTQDFIGASNAKDLNQVFATVVSAFTDNYNAKHASGWDFKELVPTVKFVSGLIAKTIVTPYQQDGFLFGGFRWISDF